MRMTSVIACVPLLAGALGAQTGPDGRLPGQGGQGVTVKLLAPSPWTHESLRYVLNEPAYVAAFLVYPGAGVRLLSPSIDSPERLHRGGYNTDQLIGVSFDNDIYLAVLGPRLAGPVYLYVIASRHPLDVARYVHRPMRLASAIGERESRSFYADVAFDALLNNAVALGDDTSWDSDVYMLWPGSGSATRLSDAMAPEGMPGTHYSYLLCTDGTARMVPDNYPFIGCPGQSRIRLSDRSPVHVQQSASAAARSTPAQQSVSANEVATVLPTIIGPRITDAQRRAAVQQDGASQRVMYTMANGDQQVAAPQAEAVSQAQLQIIDVRPNRSAESARRDRDAMHGEMSAERREHFSERAHRGEDGDGLAGSPRLSPNPRLAPNPSLSSAPGFGTSQTQSTSPRSEAHAQREFRTEQRSTPSETPRFEQPRMAQPAAAPSMPSASAGNSARERPDRIQ